MGLVACLAVGCTLTIDPSRHQGGGGDAGLDAPSADVPGADVPGADVPGLDAPDAPAIDAGMPDAGPPECTSAADCDFASRCVMGRCVLCVDDPDVVQIDSDAMLGVTDFDLLAAGTGASAELVMSWRGEGTRVYLHRTPTSAPAAPSSRSSVTDSLTLGFLTGITEVTDVAIGADDYGNSNRPIDVAMLGRNAGGTFITAALYVGDGSITSGTYPDPDRAPSGENHLGRIAVSGRAVISRRSAGAGARIESLDTSYLNPIASRTASFGAPTAALTSMDASNGFVLMAGLTGPEINTWTAGSTSVDTIDSSGRTGLPDWAQFAERGFMLAYPVDREIFVRQLSCVGSCVPSGTTRADLPTGSDEVAWVRITRLATDFALLSAERTGTTWRVVLRVLRGDLRPLTAPGGGTAWVLAETTTGTYPVGRLAVGDVAGVPYLVPAWIEQPTSGNRTLRLASEPVACP